MSGGKHCVYTIHVWQKTEGEDLSEKLRLAINTGLGTAGHVNKVECKEEQHEEHGNE